MQDRVTVVDIGSGSMKASVFERMGDSVHAISGISRGFRLCTKIGADISDRKVRVTVDFLTRVAELSSASGSRNVIAIATQAARKAGNFHVLSDEVRRRTGIEIGVISGSREAELMAECARKNMHLNRFISFDLGCGSIEVAEFDGSLLGAWSLPLSSLDLSQLGSVESAQSIVHSAFETLKFCSAEVSKFPLVGGGGTMRVARLLINGEGSDTLRYGEIKNLFDDLKDKTPDERVACGVPKIRCDIFPFGLLIMMGLMKHVGTNLISLTAGSLRMSLAMEYFGLLR
jgi:exopolyphosphatase/guanosine-5'-triphosphate,3'-diphosphate pyrophosphatase